MRSSLRVVSVVPAHRLLLAPTMSASGVEAVAVRGGVAVAGRTSQRPLPFQQPATASPANFSKRSPIPAICSDLRGRAGVATLVSLRAVAARNGFETGVLKRCVASFDRTDAASYD